MTRFARAKGSKASNERAPEPATPWNVMLEQLERSKKELEENKKREEAEKERLANYEKFLDDQKVAKKKATWCEFPEETRQKADSALEPKSKKNKVKVPIDDKTEENKSESPKKSKKKKNKEKSIFKNDVDDKSKEISEEKIAEHTFEPPKKSKKKKNKAISSVCNDDVNEKSTGKCERIVKDNPSNVNNQDVESSALLNNNKHNKLNKQNNQEHFNNNKFDKRFQNESKNPKSDKKKKFNDQNYSRRKPESDNSFHLVINGEEVELVRFEGFPILRKDAERIAELKKNMLNKGIPKGEVARTIKLERRRAEKAMARLKKQVCYNCRKGGHNLSDCPDLKSSNMQEANSFPDSICFKCGSTEHRQFECRVQKGAEFKFASCFICNEHGHIARQCPDNPKGLYPNGGGCNICGDVTHFKKDCPTMFSKPKENPTARLGTMADDFALEDVETTNAKIESAPNASKQPKRVKF